MIDILLAALAMFARDGLFALLTVAEARGRAVMAGLLDATGDLAGIAVTIFSAGEVITHGLTAHVVVLVAVLITTSFFTTMLFTRIGRRIGTAEQIDELAAMRPGPAAEALAQRIEARIDQDDRP